MKVGEFEFNLRELAGSMGDFGTLFPLAIGFIVINSMNPTGFLVMMGLTNIFLGLIYKLPMPLQPQKVIAAVAISQKWKPSLIYGSAIGTGVVWLFLAFTGLIDKIAKITPKCIIRGIQLALGISLSITGFKMMRENWILAMIAVVIVLTLRNNKKAPATIVLMGLGVGIVAFKGKLFGAIDLGISLPPLTLPTLSDIFQSFILAGIAQIPLTLTNAIIAAASLLREYFPEKSVTERKLLLNMGIINLAVPFFGGMPMCHGAGGLAGQYYFGARTGGCNIMEGLIEISIGLFLAKSIHNLFAAFPMSIVGAMMFLVGIELGKFARDIRLNKDLIPMGATLIISLVTNMPYGFLIGLLVYNLIRFIFRRKGYCKCYFKSES